MLVNFSYCCDKRQREGEGQVEGERVEPGQVYLDSQFQGIVHYGRELMAAGQIAPTVKKQILLLLFGFLSPFYLFQDQDL